MMAADRDVSLEEWLTVACSVAANKKAGAMHRLFLINRLGSP